MATVRITIIVTNISVMVTLGMALDIDLVAVQVMATAAITTIATTKKVIARASTVISSVTTRVVGTVTRPGASTEQQLTDDENNRDYIAVGATVGF